MEKVVAVHGIQGSRLGWMPLVDICQADASFVVPDLRGRGEAARGAVPEDYRLGAFSGDVAAAIDREIGDEAFVLAGWSMGVSVVLDYLSNSTYRQPKALILLSGSPCLAQINWFHADGEALLEEVVAREQRLGIRGAADHQAVAWTWASIRDTDQRASLGAIEIPTLIVHGSDDQDCPLIHAQWLADGIPHARLHVIEGGGHSLLTHNTEQIAECVRGFLVSL
ncbi:MAG: hypothetical protein JWP80_4880 [Pseudomonas sp.]|nr:hypothetical protein [Pseudomonas sp.]